MPFSLFVSLRVILSSGNEIKLLQRWETNLVVPFLCFGSVNNSIDKYDKTELRISPS